MNVVIVYTWHTDSANSDTTHEKYHETNFQDGVSDNLATALLGGQACGWVGGEADEPVFYGAYT